MSRLFPNRAVIIVISYVINRFGSPTHAPKFTDNGLTLAVDINALPPTQDL